MLNQGYLRWRLRRKERPARLRDIDALVDSKRQQSMTNNGGFLEARLNAPRVSHSFRRRASQGRPYRVYVSTSSQVARSILCRYCMS